MPKAAATDVARPFLKWAGGKRQLLPLLSRYYPSQFDHYREPFLGSGAVFFDLHARGLLEGRRATLTDSNPDLIACYAAVRDDVEHVIDELSRLARDHDRRGPAHYYEVRNERFNPQRRALANPADGGAYTPALAAIFIYLNRTCYNGLFRLNAAGEFNVPAGRYAKPRICDADNLRRVAAALRQSGVALEHRPFTRAIEKPGASDFLYFDPPYAPVSATARFTGYTSAGFTHGDQEHLRNVLIALAERGCRIIMSNSTAPEITELYANNKEVATAGFRCHTVPARRAINSTATRRGMVNEYLITNIATSTAGL